MDSLISASEQPFADSVRGPTGFIECADGVLFCAVAKEVLVEFAAMLEVITDNLLDRGKGYGGVLLGDLFCRRAFVKGGDDRGQGNSGGLH